MHHGVDADLSLHPPGEIDSGVSTSRSPRDVTEGGAVRRHASDLGDEGVADLGARLGSG